ncbi:hypothetical protein HQ544_04880 [Candidatus Falkowbacteria bacterium]|nr:hypothetical protein [Candidatus Falkowbacteria bacterium]
MKKTGKVLLVFLLLSLFIAGCGQGTDNSRSESYETLTVSLGEEFTLHKNQPAIIDDENFTITVTEFYNSPCPEDAQCNWSGKGIAYECSHNGVVEEALNATQVCGFNQEYITSDLETYVKLKITKSE